MLTADKATKVGSSCGIELMLINDVRNMPRPIPSSDEVVN